MSKDLRVAYAIQRKGKNMKSGGKVGCMDCMAQGSKCYAHGGSVENEKLHPEHEESMPEGMEEDLDAMDDEGDDMSKMAKHAKGGVVDEIMKGRKMSKGGMVDPEEDENIDQRMNLERNHFMEDEEHEINPDPSEDDMGLVGEILKERKMRRRS